MWEKRWGSPGGPIPAEGGELLLRAGSGSAPAGHGRGQANTGRTRRLPGARGSRCPLLSRPGPAGEQRPPPLPATRAQFRLCCRCPRLIPLSLCPPTGERDTIPASRGDARVGRRWPRAGAGGDKGLRAGTGGLPGHSGHSAEFRSYLQEFADVDQAMGRGRLRRENPRSAAGTRLPESPLVWFIV